MSTEERRARQRVANRKFVAAHPDRERKRQAAARASRRHLIAALKTTAGCVDCGYDRHPAALDFDHVRGVKLYNVATLQRGRWDALWAEIEKCDVRCANCHRIRTQERRAA